MALIFKERFKTFRGKALASCLFILCASLILWSRAPSALGLSRSGEIRISNSNEANSYGSQSVIVFGHSEEPAITISKYYNGPVLHKELQLSIYRVSEADLLRFLTYTKSKDENGYETYKTKPFDTNSLEFVTMLSYAGRADQKVTLPISGPGLWLVRAALDDGSYNDAVILRSDTGTVVKEGDNDLIFWQQSLRTGRSLGTGSVTVYNLEDSPKIVNTGSVDATGVARIPVSKTGDIALVNSEGGLSLVVLNLPSSYRYEGFGPDTVSRKYYLFTDRPLYKPGDTVHFKAIIRNDNDANYSVTAGSARVRVIKDYNSDEAIYEKNLPISAEGTVSGSYILPESAPTGFYQIEVAAGGDLERTAWIRGLTTFHVEEYRKPEYSVSVDTDNTDIVRGDKARYIISGQYFFGQPISNQKIQYKITSANFYDTDYFVPPPPSDGSDDSYQYGYWGGDQIKEESVMLDDKGMAEVIFDTSDIPAIRDGKDVVLVFEAIYIDESGNPGVAKKNVLVRAGEYSVYRTSYRYSGKVGEAFPMPLKLVSNMDGAKISGVNIDVEPQRHWWTRKINPDFRSEKGTSMFIYEEHTENLKKETLSSNASGDAILNFKPLNPGSYTFKVSYKDSRGNKVIKEFSIWVVSESELVYGEQSGDRIIVASDKKEYRPGESAEITITSEVPDRDIFLTFERDGVHRYKIVSLTGKSARVSTPILTTDIPNIIVEASSFSGESFDRATGDLAVSAISKKITVDLRVRGGAQNFAPGESVTIDLTSRDSVGNPIAADVALWTVDKSLYELMSEMRQPIFEAFWSHRYNSTAFAHSFEGVTSSGAEKGGCFAAGTPVLTPDGLVAIDSLRPGDTVLTRESESDPTLVRAKIKGVHKTKVAGYLIFNQDLKVTPEHILWVNGRWTLAGDVQTGDEVVTSGGEIIHISSLEWQGGQSDVYNLEIERYHTYFAGDIWVHNDKGDGESRSLFKDTAYWNPSVKTGADGHATVTFKLPDNLTTWIINGVAVTSLTEVGETKTELVVTKPVIIRPGIPNFLRTGDTAELASIVHNYTGTPGSFDATFEYPVSALNKTLKTLDLASEGIENILWTATPSTADSEAMVRMSVIKQGSGESDSIEVPLPVMPFGFFEKHADAGHGSVVFPLALKSDTDPLLSSATLYLASSFLGTLPAAMEYLIGYPYGCIEQTTSKFVPAIIALEHKDLYGPFIDRSDLGAVLNLGVKRLGNLVQSGGGWAWWQWGDVNPFVTAYATEYLVRAEKLGYKVDKSALIRTKSKFEYEIGREKDASVRIAMAYTLSQTGSGEGREMLSDFTFVTPDILALAVITNLRNGYNDKSRNGVDELLKRSIKTENTIHFAPGHRDFFPSVEASTALALRALVLAGEKDSAEQAARYLYQNRPREYWQNSFATAQVIEALTAFSEIYSGTNPDLKYEVRLDGDELAVGRITSLAKELVIPVPMGSVGEKELSVTKSGTGELYSTFVIDEFRTSRDPEPVKKGLQVDRTYKGDFIVGDTVEVRLKVSGLPTGSRYLVVEDVLPAGLVPINPVFKNTYASDANQYSNYYSGRDYPSAQEVTKEGMVTSFDYIDDGSIEFTYKARVVSRGVYYTPPAVASLMYSPEVYGRTKAVKVTVDDNRRTAAIEGESSGYVALGSILLVISVTALAFAVPQIRRYRQKQKGADQK